MRIKIFRIILFTFCIGFILISCGKSSKEVFRIDSMAVFRSVEQPKTTRNTQA